MRRSSSIEGQLQIITGDYRLYQLQARAYAALGRPLAQHRAQAEAYVRMGNVPAAVEQLQIGLKSGDGDFYQLSSAEARLRELRKLDEELRKESRKHSELVNQPRDGYDVRRARGPVAVCLMVL